MNFLQTDVFIICFAVNNRSSFNNVKYKWYPEVKHYRPSAKLVLVGKKLSQIKKGFFYNCFSVLGTKSDLRVEAQKCVTTAEGEQMRKLVKAVGYVECSSKYQWNVDKVFETAMLSLFTQEKRQKKRSSSCMII